MAEFGTYFRADGLRRTLVFIQVTKPNLRERTKVVCRPVVF